MPYKKVWVERYRKWRWHFDCHSEAYGRIRDTIDDNGQTEADLRIHEGKLLEQLKKRNSREPGSLTFGSYAAHYQEGTGDHARNSMIGDMVDDFGRKPMNQVEDAFDRFIKNQEGRNRRVWKKNKDGVLAAVEIKDSPISSATIKAYKRYFKAVCGAAMSAPRAIRLPSELNPAAAVRIGKGEKRRRPILEWERKKIIEVVGNDYEWLMPALDFARTMPIRPGDQFFDFENNDKFFAKVEKRLPGMRKHFGLTISKIDELHTMIEYLPQKTWKTEKMAKAIILPHMREYINSRIGDDECNTIFFRPGIKRLGQDSGRRYPIRLFRNTWDAILAKAGASNIEWYDWRHDAVNYLLSIGFTKDDIKRMAGWSSDDMVDWYDTEDKQRFAQRTADILRLAESKHAGIYVGNGG